MTVQDTPPARAAGRAGAGERNYHSFATCHEPAPWLGTVEDQVATWLRSRKQLDIDARVDGTHDQPEKGRTVTVRHHRHGHDRALRLVLEEDTHVGHWTTQITAVEHERGGGWVAIDVVSEDGLFVKVPGVARNLIDALHLADGGLELRGEPRVMTADRLEGLVAVLCDPDRRSPVFVAGTDHRLPFAQFVTRLKSWAEQVDGMGHVFVLDPAATAELVTRLGRAWEAPAWTVRTFRPGVELDQPPTARQHRILSTTRLAQDSDRYLQTLLGGFARDIVARHKTPAPLAAWQRMFDRLENTALTKAMTSTVPAPTVAEPAPETVSPTPASAPVAPQPADVAKPLTEASVSEEVETFLAEVTELERVRLVLGLADLSDETLARFVEQATAPRTDPRAVAEAARRLERQQARLEALQEELGQVKDELLEEQVDHMDTREELDRQAARAAWLGKQMLDAGRHDVAFGEVPADELDTAPDTYAELLDRGAALPGIVVTADRDTVLGLEAIDSTSKALRMAWDSLLALSDYVRARGAGDAASHVHHYLQNTPPGYRGMPPGKHSWTETGSTMDQYGDERSLPVPAAIDASGCATMTSHFKLARIGMRSPRLYYLDDVAGPTGKVVVGYIGPHMTNTQTS